MKIVPLNLKLMLAAKLSALRRRIAGARTRALLVESEHGLLLVEPGDMQVGRKLISTGAYSMTELKRLIGLVDHRSDVLVVGGHVGALAIPLAAQCQSVTVVEANPQTFRLLELNLLINRRANVRALNIAASDKCEQLRFLVSSANSGGSKRLPAERDYRYLYDSPEPITVPAAPLDELFPDSTFDLIVMDIEGSEYFALKGMPSLLSRAHILAIEFLPHHLAKVAGISAAEFVDQIHPFFDELTIPSKNLTVAKSEFHATLNDMFNRNETDEGLVFRKV